MKDLLAYPADIGIKILTALVEPEMTLGQKAKLLEDFYMLGVHSGRSAGLVEMRQLRMDASADASLEPALKQSVAYLNARAKVSL